MSRKYQFAYGYVIVGRRIFEELISVFCITQDELQTQLEAGKPILEIATAKGISEDDLVSKLKTA